MRCARDKVSHRGPGSAGLLRLITMTAVTLDHRDFGIVRPFYIECPTGAIYPQESRSGLAVTFVRQSPIPPMASWPASEP